MITLNAETIKTIIEDIESQQNKDRKARDFKSYQIFSGNQREYVKNAICKVYPEAHTIMRTSNVNLVKKVVNKKSKAYKEPPIRTVNSQTNENLDKIYEKGSFDDAFRKMDEGYNRSNCGLLWVQNDEFEKTK